MCGSRSLKSGNPREIAVVILVKKLFIVLLTVLMLIGLTACTSNNGNSLGNGQTTDASSYTISFTDDMGNEINLTKPCTRIISLYSAHTENLYFLGAGDYVIGVNSTAIYPPDAAMKTVYDYNADPENVIAAEPDLVLIRPFINRKNPDFVAALENSGLTVVSLYPESFEEFDGYIEKLAMLTGTADMAKQKLVEFHNALAKVSDLTADVEDRQKIFFESTDVNLRTITPDSMPAKAIEIAGGINIAGAIEPISEGSSIASFGVEKVLDLADEIDVYVSQRGAMNAGGNLHTISIRPGFDTIKAVKEGRVFEINEKIISSPSFRYSLGVFEMARYLYPKVMDKLDIFYTDQIADKRDLANILVRFNHQPVYIPSSSKYYQTEHEGHTYGLFQDVTWEDMDFDNIETAVMAGWMDSDEKEGKEYFDPDSPVSREMLAKAIYMMGDYKKKSEHIEIKDLEKCSVPMIAQTLVDNGVFYLNDGVFEPQQQMTQKEVLAVLNNLPQ